jgi:hypothetical protein
VAAVGLLLLLALVLRLNGLGEVPGITDNADELQFTWAGLNLIEHADAYTWSYFPAYPSHTTFEAFGTGYPMVHHWLDHPPLFALVMGGWAWLLGTREMAAVDPAQIRLLPVAFSLAALLLAYLLGRRVLGSGPALAAGLLLATSPAAVLLSRQAEPESLQAPLLLGALLLVARRLDGTCGRFWVVGLALISFAAPLLKVSGVAVGGACAVVLLARGYWKAAVVAAGAAALGLLAYAAYGWAVDWPLFLRVVAEQNANRVGVMSGFDFIAEPAGVNRRLRDGWWLLGWIGIGLWMLARRGRRELLLAWPAAAYVATMVVLAGERQVEQYGWYKVILYPEVYLAAGFLLWWAAASPSLSRLALVLSLGGATATQLWLNGAQPWIPNPVLAVALMGAVLLPAALAAWPRAGAWAPGLARGVAAAAAAVLLLGNVAESARLESILTRL